MQPYEQVIREFNTQLSPAGLRVSFSNTLRGARPDGIVIVGMGGSVLAGEILRAAKAEVGLKLPVYVWRDYGLPENTDFRRPLYIFMSFSGNTEETISGLKFLLKRGRSRITVITAGGELQRLARRYRLPLVEFEPGILTPRQAIGIMFYSLIEILRRVGLTLKVSSFTRIKPPSLRGIGKALAARLHGRLITIYTDHAHRALGYIWKIKFNETAKTLAFANVVPEMNHNELVGFEKLKTSMAALFLLDNTSRSPRLKKRFRLNQLLLRSRGVRVITLPLKGKSFLEKTWRAIILADWTAYFLAKLNRVDPAKTAVIDELKARMKQ